MTALTVTGKVQRRMAFTLPILLLWLGTAFSGCGGGAPVQSTLNNSSKTLTSLSITPDNPSVALGNSEQFAATGVFSDNSREDITQTVVWSSQQPEVATITASGVAHSKKVGTTTVKAVSGSIAGSTTLTVSAAVPISIAITPPNPAMPKGSTQQLTATGSFTDGSTQDMTSSVSWAVSPPSVATVTSTGVIHAQAIGSANITASSGSVRGTDPLAVLAPTLVSIAVTPPNPAMPKGSTQQLTATGSFTDGSTQDMTSSVLWAVSPPSVATVTSTGLIHAQAIGSANITASSGSVCGTDPLAVLAPTLVSIAVTPPNPAMPKGSTQQLTATASFTDGSTQDMTSSVLWAVSPPSVATVTSTGLIHALALGSASITATAVSVRGTDTLTVSEPTLVSVAVTPPNPSVPKGNTQQLTATASFTDGSTQDITNAVAWTSSSPSVATVSGNGLLSAHALGTASIKASSGSISGVDAVAVSSPILLSIAVTPANPSIALGFKQQFKAMGMLTDGSTKDITQSVTWTTARPQIATISSLGQATGLQIGTTGVTAASGSIAGFSILSITPPILLSIAVEPANPSIPLGSSKQLQATGTFSDGTTSDLTPTATWSSAQPAIAGVRFGVALGKEVGTTTISALSGSVNGSATLAVTPAVLSSIAVTPANPDLEVASTVQLTATGTSTDGSAQDITNSVVWTASPTSVASVSKAGLVTGQGPGRAVISAVSGAVTGADTILVSAVSLALTPASPGLAVGSTMQLHAIATFSNGSTGDVTTSVAWSSTTPAVAPVNITGVAMGETAGTTTVSANFASLRGAATLTVRPMVAINYFANANIAGLSSATVSVSNTGLTATGLCAMFYVFDESEEMSECCGCQVSIDDLRTLLVDTDLTGNPLTGSMPTRGVVKIVSADMASNPSCDPSSIAPKGAVVAWSTHLQSASQSSFVATDGAFRPQLLSNVEQSNLQSKCASIKELGSGHGICTCGSGD
jgi:trimeric autotransporter adhesin